VGRKWPLAILVHGWGDRSLLVSRMLAKDLAKKGIATFMLYLVFHSRRMPDVIKRRLPRLTDDQWYEGYLSSVAEIGRIVDWASANEEIDKEKIALVGVSLGGVLSCIAMALDRRVKAGVIIIAGGNWENPTWLSRMGYKKTRQEYEEGLKLYKEYLGQVEAKGFEQVEPPKRSYYTDPVTFGRYLRGRPVKMINALWDERMPKRATLDLWEAMGKPAIKWFPGTHTTVWLLYPLIRNEIIVFLDSTFKE
jgi:esterase/lipase